MYEENTPSKIFTTKLTANDATAQEPLGIIRELADGRKFRYVQMTGSALALGKLIMPATKVTVTDVSVGSTTNGPDGATTTLSTDADAAWTADAYIGWYFQVKTGGSGSKEPIKIVGNTKTTLTLEKQLTTTVAALDDGEILAGNAAGILSTANDLDVSILGVGIGTITEDYYGWVQVSGIAAVYSDAVTEGLTITPGGDVAGKAIAPSDDDQNVIGVCIATSGTAEYLTADLRIA